MVFEENIYPLRNQGESSWPGLNKQVIFIQDEDKDDLNKSIETTQNLRSDENQILHEQPQEHDVNEEELNSQRTKVQQVSFETRPYRKIVMPSKCKDFLVDMTQLSRNEEESSLNHKALLCTLSRDMRIILKNIKLLYKMCSLLRNHGIMKKLRTTKAGELP